MKDALVDVAVLVLFFNRPGLLSRVFDQVKKARPSKLFLYQDGAREGRKDDLIGIRACRKIVENIDWKCEVHKLYQEKNFGCDPSNYLSQKWAFSFVDKCIVLEDDDVPSVSFFRFCKELLDRYENDTRVTMIAGLNHEGTTPNMPCDYFFTSNCSIWGWASWKRVVDQWEGDYGFLKNETAVRQLKDLIKARNYRKDFMKTCLAHQKTGKEYYESILISNMMLNSGLSIVPTKNMISNIGDTADSTHFTGGASRMPKGLRRIFSLERFEQEFPLRHPDYIIEDCGYKERVYRIMAWNHPVIQFWRSLEGALFKLRYGDLKGIQKALKRRLCR